jgi:hypothetical protein
MDMSYSAAAFANRLTWRFSILGLTLINLGVGENWSFNLARIFAKLRMNVKKLISLNAFSNPFELSQLYKS